MANDIVVGVKIDGLSQNASGIEKLTASINSFAGPAKNMQDSLQNIEKSLLNVSGKALKEFSTTMLKTTALIGGLFAAHEIVKEASAFEDVVNTLNVTLGSLGIYSKKTSDNLISFASNIQKTTRFTDDQAISTINLLGTMTRLNEEGLKKATKLTLDVATAFRIDLDTATRLVGKTLEGNTAAFGRYGIKIKGANDEAGRLANALEALSSINGRAEKDLNTFGGALDFLKHGFDDILKAIGKFIVSDPIIVGAIKRIGEGFLALADAISGIKGSITNVVISILDSLLSFGLTFQVIYDQFKAFMIAGLLTGIILLGRSIKTFVVTAIADLVLLGQSFITFGASSTIALYGLEAAAIALRRALSLIAVGLGIGAITLAFGELVVYILKAKDEVGSWSKLYQETILRLSIYFDRLLIKVDELSLAGSNLGKKLNESLSSFFNKIGNLLGLPPIQLKLNGDNTKAVTEDIKKLEEEIKKTELAIKSLQKAPIVGNDPLKDLKFNLEKFKSEFEKAREGINGKGKGPEIDTAGIAKAKSEFESLYKTLEGLSEGELGKENAINQERINIIYQALALRVATTKQANEALRNLAKDHEDKVNKIREASAEKEKKRLEEQLRLQKEAFDKAFNFAKANPLGSLFGQKEQKPLNEIKTVISAKVIGEIQGFGEALKSGAEGARSLVTAASAGAIESIAPGIGTAVKPFLDAFAQGPEATKKMVKEFSAGITETVKNIIKAAPAFVTALIKEIPNLVITLVKTLIHEIPLFISEFVKYIGEAFKNLLSKLNPFSSQGPVGGFFKKIGNFFGFAEGGKIASGGIPGKDSIPIAVTPGELVVDRSLTNKMQEYFANPNRSDLSGSDITNNLLLQVISLLQKPHDINTSVQFNNKTLADIMITLNRTNTRTV